MRYYLPTELRTFYLDIVVALTRGIFLSLTTSDVTNFET